MPKKDLMSEILEEFFVPVSEKRKRLAETLTATLLTHSMNIARRHCLPAEVYHNARIFAALNSFFNQIKTNANKAI